MQCLVKNMPDGFDSKPAVVCGAVGRACFQSVKNTLENHGRMRGLVSVS